ncbi:MAG: GDSL-type esterase/lipase family protein [Bacteroidales bacterium]|nr:GDSL-type esterase/lipase family protein [Bacteroidales bacterium]
MNKHTFLHRLLYSSALLLLMTLIGVLTSAFTPPSVLSLPLCEAAEQPRQQPQQLDDEATEDEQELRENPDIEISDLIDADDMVNIPTFIHSAKNEITLNGADWSQLISKLYRSTTNPVSILHIGDSHLQADVATGHVRQRLQLLYGNAGRGLIAPLKLSSTNEPHDYLFRSPANWESIKLIKQPWKGEMGLTGVAISPFKTTSEITVATVAVDDYNPFSSVVLYHKGDLKVTNVKNIAGVAMPFTTHDLDANRLRVDIYDPQESVTLSLSHPTSLWLYGALLSGDRPGLFYHVVGNNGATFSHYNKVASLPQQAATLDPSLIIISLGTNEAFGRLDVEGFLREVDRLVKGLQQECPDAQILLTTPMECQRPTYRTVGKRRRKTGKYSVNQNILPLRNALLRYGKQHGVAVYDWYEVAGGSGASQRWLDKKLLSTDRVHLTQQGYLVMGELLFQALTNLFTTPPPDSSTERQ